MEILKSFSFSNKNKEDVISKRGKKDVGIESVTDKQAKISRRDFLKLGGAMGLAIAAKSLLNKTEKITSISSSLQNSDSETKKADLDALEDNNLPDTESITEIELEDARAIEEFVDYHTVGEIKLHGINLQNILTNHWKKEFQNNQKLNSSLISAYASMQNQADDLKKIFRDEGVPEEYCYLAIPESFWNLKAHNKSGARGPYQLLESTALRQGLRVNKKIDERILPLPSAKAAVKELKRLRQETRSWDLAFSAYNGAKVWPYLNADYKKERDEEGGLFHYDGFLKFSGEKITSLRNEIRDNPHIKYEVDENDTISGIAKRFQRSVEEIKKYNRIRSDILKPKQIILIPLHDKEKDYHAALERSGFIENLNYPAKFKAVLELIDEGYVAAQLEELNNKKLLASNK